MARPYTASSKDDAIAWPPRGDRLCWWENQRLLSSWFRFWDSYKPNCVRFGIQYALCKTAKLCTSSLSLMVCNKILQKLKLIHLTCGKCCCPFKFSVKTLSKSGELYAFHKFWINSTRIQDTGHISLIPGWSQQIQDGWQSYVKMEAVIVQYGLGHCCASAVNAMTLCPSNCLVTSHATPYNSSGNLVFLH